MEKGLDTVMKRICLGLREVSIALFTGATDQRKGTKHTRFRRTTAWRYCETLLLYTLWLSPETTWSSAFSQRIYILVYLRSLFSVRHACAFPSVFFFARAVRTRHDLACLMPSQNRIDRSRPALLCVACHLNMLGI